MEYFDDINKYYENQGKGKIYFLVLFLVASLIGWFFIIYYKPILIETGCSNIAEKSSNILSPKNNVIYSNDYSFDELKSSCIRESTK